MEIRRTANAGVLLTLDGISILLDGVCREYKPYPATPDSEKDAIRKCWPDVVAFTHVHEDHYDPDFAAEFQRQTGGVILGPEDLAGCVTTQEIQVGPVTVTAVKSRHIGAAFKDTQHVSFIVQGSRCIWFTGDASPLQWKDRADLPSPDVVIAPYAYAATPSALHLVESLGAKELVILHLPEREDDSLGLWDAVNGTLQEGTTLKVYIPSMSQKQSLLGFK